MRVGRVAAARVAAASVEVHRRVRVAATSVEVRVAAESPAAESSGVLCSRVLGRVAAAESSAARVATAAESAAVQEGDFARRTQN